MERIDCLLQLTLTPGLGAASILKLLAYFGDALSVLESADVGSVCDALKRKSDSQEAVRVYHLIESARGLNPRAEMERANATGVRFVAYDSPDYPPSLNSLNRPPVLLYVKGQLPITEDYAIAIVGTRDTTDYGIRQTKRFASRLAKEGCLIISGLARGVDAEAHWSALEAGGRTNAVMGCGLSSIYPPENEDLAKEIIKTGCLISEFSMLYRPDKRTFPSRNRIIAALSQAVLITEAPSKSGALITAEYAEECHRQVFIIPARVDDLLSEGCLDLLKDGAAVASKPDDISDFLATIDYSESGNMFVGDMSKTKGVTRQAEELPQGFAYAKSLSVPELPKPPFIPAEEEKIESLNRFTGGSPALSSGDKEVDSHVPEVKVKPKKRETVSQKPKGKSAISDVLSPERQKILSCLNFKDPMPIDVIVARSMLPVDRVTIELLQMELLRKVESLPGKFYLLRRVDG